MRRYYYYNGTETPFDGLFTKYGIWRCWWLKWYEKIQLTFCKKITGKPRITDINMN